jgi:hypothetical protein
MKALEKKISTKHSSGPQKTLDNSLPDLSQHPIVLRKVSEARAFLEKHPIPDHILNRVRSDK